MQSISEQFVPHANPSTGLFQAVFSPRDRQDQLTVALIIESTTNRISAPTTISLTSNLFNPFNNFQAAGANVPGFGASIKQRFQQYNLTHTWTLSNSTGE